MKRVHVSSLFLPLLIIVFSGCTQRLGDLTIASTKNVAFTREGGIGTQYVEVGDCEGRDFDYLIVFIPTGTPNIEDAADNCLDNGDGDLMTNVVLRSRFIYFVLGAQTGYLVEGDVWKEASTSDLLDPDKETYELVMGSGGPQLISTKTAQSRGPVFDSRNPNSFIMIDESVADE